VAPARFDAVREFLRKRGLRDPVVHISQVVSLDLDGDGKIDVVVRSTYYEGDAISVYEYQPAAVKKVLSVGCGL
jgi:hypothetical protein